MGSRYQAIRLHMSVPLLPPFDAPHAACQADLMVNEPTVGDTALFPQEQREYRGQPEYRRMSPQEAQSFFRLMGVYGAKFNWVVATTTEIGVGHYRQATDFADALGYAGLRDHTTFVALPFEHKLLGKAYHTFQNTRALNNKISEIIDNPHCIPLIDKVQRRSHVWQHLLHTINTSPSYEREKPTIFITTHAAQERAAIFLMNAELVDGYALIAAVPDTWRGGSLAAMTAQRNPYNALHLVVVHNASTAAEYHAVRPSSTAIVRPLGTASDPYFLLEEPRTYEGPFHIGIEFSGNNIHTYSSLIMKFIKSIQYQLRDEEVWLSVHLMNHMHTRTEMKNLVSRLHLCGVSTIRLLYADTLEEAITTRKSYIRGTLDENWPAPDVVISKGGEVPLEYRGNQLIIAVWGEGHERDDILVGVKEGRTLDFRSVPPDHWYASLVSACKLRAFSPPHIPQSYAVFAPLLIFDPHALDEFLIPCVESPKAQAHHDTKVPISTHNMDKKRTLE